MQFEGGFCLKDALKTHFSARQTAKIAPQNEANKRVMWCRRSRRHMETARMYRLVCTNRDSVSHKRNSISIWHKLISNHNFRQKIKADEKCKLWGTHCIVRRGSMAVSTERSSVHSRGVYNASAIAR